MSEQENGYVDQLYNENVIACLDALKEADDAVVSINKDMFNQICEVCHNIIDDGGDIDFVKKTLRSFEKRYKKERELQHMPGSYRSAKSVIISAIKEGVDLVDGGGEAYGKTALEKETSRARKNKDSNKDKSAEQLVADALQLLEKAEWCRVDNSDNLGYLITGAQTKIEVLRGKFL